MLTWTLVAFVGACAGPARATAPTGPAVRERLERLTERYDALRDRLAQATAAAKAARTAARMQERRLRAARLRAARTAATGYMNNGSDPDLAFAAARDPRAFLDRASAMRFLTAARSAGVRDLTWAAQAAVFARQTARLRLARARRLAGEVAAQRRRVARLNRRARVETAIPRRVGSVPRVAGSGTASAALRAALSRLGRPYVWGGPGPGAFDCSGLTMWAFRQAGIGLPHSSTEQFAVGMPVPRDRLRPGDLVFFYADRHHVGMYAGGGRVVHAPHSGDVVRLVPVGSMPYAAAVRIA